MLGSVAENDIGVMAPSSQPTPPVTLGLEPRAQGLALKRKVANYTARSFSIT